MAIIILGGDRLGKILQLLQQQGFGLVGRETGRKKGHQKAAIQQAAAGVSLFTDYLNHLLVLQAFKTTEA